MPTSLFLTHKILKNFPQKGQENGPVGRKKKKKKTESRDSKVESNDSPETPDRWETSDILGLPSGLKKEGLACTAAQADVDEPIPFGEAEKGSQHSHLTPHTATCLKLGESVAHSDSPHSWLNMTRRGPPHGWLTIPCCAMAG